MKIDWKEYEDKDHVLSWIIPSLMADIGMDKFQKFDSSCLNITMAINGIDVRINRTFNILNDQLDDMISKAKEEERKDLRDVTEGLREYLDQLDDMQGNR